MFLIAVAVILVTGLVVALRRGPGVLTLAVAAVGLLALVWFPFMGLVEPQPREPVTHQLSSLRPLTGAGGYAQLSSSGERSAAIVTFAVEEEDGRTVLQTALGRDSTFVAGGGPRVTITRYYIPAGLLAPWDLDAGQADYEFVVPTSQVTREG